jgi:hypothetical protein
MALQRRKKGGFAYEKRARWRPLPLRSSNRRRETARTCGTGRRLSRHRYLQTRRTTKHRAKKTPPFSFQRFFPFRPEPVLVVHRLMPFHLSKRRFANKTKTLWPSFSIFLFPLFIDLKSVAPSEQRKEPFFLNFSYVCPEPVLVKRRHDS